MIIRLATPTDAHTLARVHVASWQAAYRDLLPDSVLAHLSVAAFEDRWRRRLEAGEGITYVCEIQQQIAGFFLIGPNRDEDEHPGRVGELYAIYLLPTCWGMRIGQVLWERSLPELLEQGFREVTVWVLEENARARRFYEKAGFCLEPDSTKPIVLSGVALPQVRYRLTLEQGG